MNADGTGQTQLTTMTVTPDGETSDKDPHWSPDGMKILLTRSTNNFSNFYTMNANGSNFTQLFNFGGRGVDWSADGLAVVFQQFNEVCRANVDGTNFKCVTNNIYYDFSPNWQPLPNAGLPPDGTPPTAANLTATARRHLELISTGWPVQMLNLGSQVRSGRCRVRFCFFFQHCHARPTVTDSSAIPNSTYKYRVRRERATPALFSSYRMSRQLHSGLVLIPRRFRYA